MKKIKLFIVFIITTCILFTAVACKPNRKEAEKFKGFLSVNVYDSAKEAAEAFYNEQIMGGDYADCEFKSYSFKKELTKNEINGLDLGDLHADEVLYGERGKVNFLYGDEVFSNTVYLLQVEEGYHYYVLQPKDEEAVCYDYYAHLVSEEILSNVTVVTKAMIVSEQDGYSRQTEVQIQYWYKGNYIKYEAVLRKFFNGGINETVFSGFIVNNEDGCAILGINDKDQYVDITNEDTILFTNSNKNDAYMVNVMSQMFRSGHNWFKVDEERYVLRQIEEATLASLFEGVYFAEESGQVQAITYSLIVSNQKITSTAMNIHAITSDESQELYITIESTLSAYNDTTFSVPEEVKDYTDIK